MRNNTDNPRVGAEFQKMVVDYFTETYQKDFELEKKIPIGNPSKEHKFDIVDCDNSIAIECKCYTWTESGNVPSAKIGFTNEAAFYLSFLPNSFSKFIVMKYDFCDKRKESLAQYYYRTNKHLLGNTIVAEFNVDNKEFSIVSKI